MVHSKDTPRRAESSMLGLRKRAVTLLPSLGLTVICGFRCGQPAPTKEVRKAPFISNLTLSAQEWLLPRWTVFSIRSCKMAIFLFLWNLLAEILP